MIEGLVFAGVLSGIAAVCFAHEDDDPRRNPEYWVDPSVMEHYARRRY